MTTAQVCSGLRPGSLLGLRPRVRGQGEGFWADPVSILINLIQVSGRWGSISGQRANNLSRTVTPFAALPCPVPPYSLEEPKRFPSPALSAALVPSGLSPAKLVSLTAWEGPAASSSPQVSALPSSFPPHVAFSSSTHLPSSKSPTLA